MNRSLASVQFVSALAPIPGADAIVCASVLGWKCVVKAGEFNVGDKAVYFEIDSILPDRPEFDFMRQRDFRVRTIKLRGQLSQGLALPLAMCSVEADTPVGADLTEALGIQKWEAPEPANPDALGGLPFGIPRTDEPRIQSYPGLLDELRGVVCQVTVKIDGSSATYAIHDGEFVVCSRNQRLWPESANWYTRVARENGIEEKLRSLCATYGTELALQGEVYGPGIQGNALNCGKLHFAVFNVWDIHARRYRADLCSAVVGCGLENVPDLPGITIDDNTTVESLLVMASGRYPSGHPREGIVVRPLDERYSPTLQGRASFKVINNDFLLKVKQ